MSKVYLFAFHASDGRIILKVGFTTKTLLARYTALIYLNPFQNITEGILLEAVSVPGVLVREIETMVKHQFDQSAQTLELRKKGREWFEWRGSPHIISTIELFTAARSIFREAVSNTSGVKVIDDALWGEAFRVYRNKRGLLDFFTQRWYCNHWPKQLANALDKAPRLCEAERIRLKSELMTIADVRKRIGKVNNLVDDNDAHRHETMEGEKVYIFAFRGESNQLVLKIGCSTRSRLLQIYNELLESSKQTSIPFKPKDGIILAAALVPKSSGRAITQAIRKELTEISSEWTLKRYGLNYFELGGSTDIASTINFLSKSAVLFQSTLSGLARNAAHYSEQLSGEVSRCRKVNGRLVSKSSYYEPSSWPMEILTLLEESQKLPISEKDTLRDLLLEIGVFRTAHSLLVKKSKLIAEKMKGIVKPVEIEEIVKGIEKRVVERVKKIVAEEVEIFIGKEVKQDIENEYDKSCPELKPSEKEEFKSEYSKGAWGKASFNRSIDGIHESIYHPFSLSRQISTANSGLCLMPLKARRCYVWERRVFSTIMRRRIPIIF